MCGIVGLFSEQSKEQRERRVGAMVAALVSRGPDDKGIWSDENTPLTLGHARLSILDVSSAGHQPMRSRSGRFTLVYNGEIYNFKGLRDSLQQRGASFKGGSDTEVLLTCLEEFGLRSTLSKLNGMFAFAVWDCEERTLSIVRDRLGIKPLYFGKIGADFVFASELKALRAAGLKMELDRNAVAQFLHYSYVPAPNSIVKGITKLLPGSFATIFVDALADDETFVPEIEHFWSIDDVANQERVLDGTEAVNLVHQGLLDAVSRRLISDVPLGAFLSGGVDSSLVVACMQAQSSEPVQTFTIGFEEAGYNEADDAKKIARHLGTAHTEMYLTASDAQAVIPMLATVYDEPFADSSQIPTLLVSKLASDHVTVCLSGDGGDELFCGYNRYVWAAKIWQVLRILPRSQRRLLKCILECVSPRHWDLVFNLVAGVLPDSAQFKLPGDKIAKLCEVLDVGSFEELYQRLVAHWDTPDLVRGGSLTKLDGLHSSFTGRTNSTIAMMLADTRGYLPDDLLTKVDRASMAHSLEVRVPFLDHTLVELVWRLKDADRIQQRGGRGKVILRDILANYVPPEMYERPKMGFSVPVGEWLRGPLREWAEAMLDEKRLESQGLLEVATVREKWADHLSFRSNSQYYLWDILMLQSWLDEDFVDV